MDVDFRSIAIFLHKKGLKSYEIQYEIDSVFGEGSYSYGAITQSISTLSFTSSQSDKGKIQENFIHKQRIENIRKTLENFPFFSIREIS